MTDKLVISDVKGHAIITSGIHKVSMEFNDGMVIHLDTPDKRCVLISTAGDVTIRNGGIEGEVIGAVLAKS